MIDKQCFSDQVMTLLPALHRIAQGILQNEAEAQDAVQQALLKAWERRSQARENSFRAWVSAIVVNQSRDMLRARKRMTPVETILDIPVEEPGYEPPDPILREALTHLKEEMRLPLLLKYAEGYSLMEIAQILHMPVTVVKNRLYRGRKALQKDIVQRREAERE